MVHLNGNVMAVVDTETTGLDPVLNEIIEISIIPMDSDMKPIDTMPFSIIMKPERLHHIEPEAMSVNKRSLAKILQVGFDKEKAADLLIEWFENLKLPVNKRLAPLGQNYPFDQKFIEAWLGNLNYNYIFDYHIRDTASVALFLNDRAAFHAERIPFPKVNLAYLCSQLKLKNPAPHTALGDCQATMMVYRQLVESGLFSVS